jgi:hypothetical protein
MNKYKVGDKVIYRSFLSKTGNKATIMTVSTIIDAENKENKGKYFYEINNGNGIISEESIIGLDTAKTMIFYIDEVELLSINDFLKILLAKDFDFQKPVSIEINKNQIILTQC